MAEYTGLLALLAAALLYAAWRESTQNNLRDAGLLAAFAAATTLGGVAVWLG